MKFKITFLKAYSHWFEINDKLVFSWKDNWKPINIFYYNNGFWKTTLYSLIKVTLELKKIGKEYDFISRFELGCKINNKEYIIKNSKLKLEVFSNEKSINVEKFREDILEKEVLNRNEVLSVLWKNEKWEQERNTLPSLLRFNFFTDKNYKNYWENTCSLIDAHLDGTTKWMLLNYVLGEKYDYDKIALFKKAYRYWAQENYLNKNKRFYRKYKEYFLDESTNQSKLFEYNESELEEKIKERFEVKNKLIQINSILDKLKSLQEITNNHLPNKIDIINLIKNEIEFLNRELKLYLQKDRELKEQILDIKNKYSDFIKKIPTKDKKRFEELKAAHNFISENKRYIENYYQTHKTEFNKYLQEFLYKLTSFLFELENNIKFNLEELKIWLRKTESIKWDWRLKILRFLSAVAIVLYKSKYYYARNLWVLFFDAPFYGVDMLNIIKALESIINYLKDNKEIKTQIFLFVTKKEIKEQEDSFEIFCKENWDYINLCTYWNNCNKKYLFEDCIYN